MYQLPQINTTRIPAGDLHRDMLLVDIEESLCTEHSYRQEIRRILKSLPDPTLFARYGQMGYYLDLDNIQLFEVLLNEIEKLDYECTHMSLSPKRTIQFVRKELDLKTAIIVTSDQMTKILVDVYNIIQELAK